MRLGPAAAWRAIGVTLLLGCSAAPPSPAGPSVIRGGPRIAARGDQTCVVLPGGIVRCWGGNAHGQLGDGTRDERSGAVAVRGISGAISVAVGLEHACALLADGSVRCWGRNRHAQLGNKTVTSESAVPVAVPGLSNVIQIAAGNEHTCALLADGRVKCWGINFHAVLGQGDDVARDPEESGLLESNEPLLVKRLSGARAIAAGDEVTCALLASGNVRCWGDIEAQIRAGGGGGPANVLAGGDKGWPLSEVTAVAPGSGHTCALSVDATVRCWGANEHGQLGEENRTVASRYAPERAAALEGVTAIAAGRRHTCALRRDGTVECWGDGEGGQLGAGPAVASTWNPRAVRVQGLAGVTAIAASATHTCALAGERAVKCWGSNELGQLGDGTKTDSAVPVDVRGLGP